MPAFICTACGTQYPSSEAPPGACLICTDERQFVPASGQSWTTLERLRNAYSNKFRRLATGLTTIETTPAFGIGQRAILARTPAGNVLWDCLALIDDATVDLLNGMGGVSAIAISHPHYYTTMVEWSRALGECPIYLHAADRPVGDAGGPRGAVLGGGHQANRARPFAGSVGRTLRRRYRPPLGRIGVKVAVYCSRAISSRWSRAGMSALCGPTRNLIPLSAAKVQRMAEILEPFAFDAVYGSFSGRGQIDANGKQMVAASVARYIARISET